MKTRGIVGHTRVPAYALIKTNIIDVESGHVSARWDIQGAIAS
jgi:hypothetical protein